MPAIIHPGPNRKNHCPRQNAVSFAYEIFAFFYRACKPKNDTSANTVFFSKTAFYAFLSKCFY